MIFWFIALTLSDAMSWMSSIGAHAEQWLIPCDRRESWDEEKEQERGQEEQGAGSRRHGFGDLTYLFAHSDDLLGTDVTKDNLVA